MSTAGIPVLGSVTLSGATSIIRKEKDYIYEHQVAGKDGGLVERVGSASTRFEIKGFLREADADSQYQSLVALLGQTSNLSIPTFGSGYFLAASGTTVFVESFGGNWIPGHGYPRYDYDLKLVSTNATQPAATSITSQLIQVRYGAQNSQSTFNFAFLSNVTAGDTLVVVASSASATPAMAVSDSLGNTWTQINIANSTNSQGRAWKTVTSTGGADTITLTASVNTNFSIAIIEWMNPSSIVSNGAFNDGGVGEPNLFLGVAGGVSTGSLRVSALGYSLGAGNMNVAITGTIQANSQVQPAQANAVVGTFTGNPITLWQCDSVNNPQFALISVGIT